MRSYDAVMYSRLRSGMEREGSDEAGLLGMVLIVRGRCEVACF